MSITISDRHSSSQDDGASGTSKMAASGSISASYYSAVPPTWRFRGRPERTIVISTARTHDKEFLMTDNHDDLATTRDADPEEVEYMFAQTASGLDIDDGRITAEAD
jgi:hypothetical protein